MEELLENLIPLYNKEFYLAYLCGEDVVLPIPDGNTEHYLAYLCGMDVTIPDVPDGRTETYLAYKCGEDVVLPDPMYRIEYYLAKWCGLDCEVPEPMYRIEYWLAQLANSGELKTVTGNPISVSDALAKPAESLSIEILPQQDLHGYDSPWPAGGGKNMLDPDKRTESSQNIYYYFTDGIVLKAGTYTLSISGENAAGLYVHKKADGSTAAVKYNNTVLTFTLAEDLSVYIDIYYSTAPSDMSAVKCQLESGSTPSAWSPYSNICPITGHTGVNIPRTGVNVWDEEWEAGGLANATGATFPASDRIRSINYSPCSASTSYYGKSPTQYLSIFWYDSSKAFISWEGASNKVITSPSNAAFFKIVLANNVTTYNNDISINYPSTNHDYHAYTGTTYSIDWQDEAGTVYGGELDVTTGVLTVTHGIIDLGDLNYNPSTYAGVFGGLAVVTPSPKPVASLSTVANAVCSALGVVSDATFNSDGVKGEVAINTFGYLKVKGVNATTKEELKAEMTGIMLCYELATPLTYQLTPTQVEMLLGNNVLWNDINGDMTLEYLADGPADDVDALQILLGNRYVNNGEPDEATDKEALEILLGGNTR